MILLSLDLGGVARSIRFRVGNVESLLVPEFAAEILAENDTNMGHGLSHVVLIWCAPTFGPWSRMCSPRAEVCRLDLVDGL